MIIVRSNEKPIPVEVVAEKPADTQEKEGSKLSALEETSEQNESPESETEETEETEGQGKEENKEDNKNEAPKKKGGFQRRIDKLNSRVSAKEQEVEYWKQQALKSASATTPTSESKPKAAEGKPKPESFDTHTDYVEALTDWKTETKLQERDAKQFKETFDREQTKIVSSYTEKEKAFSAKNADFADVISEVDHIPISASLRDILLTSDTGPQLAYELAKNPEDYARIAKLPPLACAREIGKLEYRLSSKSSSSESVEKKITKAPKPIDPVGTGGKGSAPKSISDPSLSQREYEALRREQMKKRRQA